MAQPLVITADLHLHPFKLNSNDGGRDRLRDGLDALAQTLNVAQQLNATWIFAGDMKVPRTTWVQEALNGAIDVFEAYNHVDKILLPGNHDGPNLPGGSGLRAFEACERTFLCELPESLPATAPGVAVWPGDADGALLEQFLARAEKDGCKVLLGHGLFEGCLLSPGIAAPGGLTPSAFGIGQADSPFPLAVFGDVHRGQIFTHETGRFGRWTPWDQLFDLKRGGGPQAGARYPKTWGDPAGNLLAITKGFKGQIIYPGDPYQQNWGEAGEEPKGVVVVNPDTEEISLVPIKSPRYIAQDWTESHPSALADWIEKYAESKWEGNFVRLVLPEWGTAKAVASMLKLVEAGCGARSFEVIIKRAATSEVRAEVDSTMGADELLAAYVKAKPPQGLNETMVLEAGKRLWGKP